jgi:hypothetical protein
LAEGWENLTSFLSAKVPHKGLFWCGVVPKRFWLESGFCDGGTWRKWGVLLEKLPLPPNTALAWSGVTKAGTGNMYISGRAHRWSPSVPYDRFAILPSTFGLLW